VNENLRDRILRQLETLSDERGYQVLDYVEFLTERYAEKPTAGANPFTRFTDAVEDRLRAGRVSASAIAETVSLMNKAANVFNGAVQATKTAATEFVNAATPAASPPRAPGQPEAPAGPEAASSPAGDVPKPGSGEEKL
jgi:hypothetical protein